MTALLSLRTLRHWVPGLVVAVAGLAASAWLVRQQEAVGEAIAKARFEDEARASADAISQRITAYTEIVSGLRDLFLVNPALSQAEFDRVVAARELQHRYPEIKNLSFVRWVPAADLPAFEARLRADAQREHRDTANLIHPRSEQSDYYVTQYVWPALGNEGIQGLEISSQPNNLAALLAGRATGQPAVSAPFDLLQERDRRAGFVLRVPVFVADGSGEPHGRFIGAVAASVHAGNMLRTVELYGFLRDMALRVEDVGSVEDIGAVDRPVLLAATSTAQPAAHALQEVRELQVHDRRWRLTLSATTSLLSQAERLLPWWIGGGAAVTTLLLAALVTLLSRQRALALTEAQASQEALLKSEERFRALFNQAAVGVAQIHTPTGRFVRANQKYCSILGYTADELLLLDFQSLSYPGEFAEDLAQMERLKAGEIAEFHLEKRVLRKDRQAIWVDLTVSPMWQPGEAPSYHIGVVQDITERLRMQDALRDNEMHLRGILDHLPVGVCLVQHDGRITFRNERFMQICGYSEQDVPDADAWWARAFPDAELRERTRRHWMAEREKARACDGTIAASEITIRSEDGQRRVIELGGVLLGDNHLVTMVDLSQRKAAEEEIKYLAFYDLLTRLPNRRLLLDRLQQAVAASARRQRCGALLMLDLDNFKMLNETRGHDCGDSLLRQVAQRLRECTHEDDTVARHGGDEFVVVLEDLAGSPEEAAARAEETGQKILGALREPYQLEGEAYHTTVSMGAAIFQGLSDSVDELLKRADLAMYQAKAAGRNSLQFYDPNVQAVVRARAALELDMRAGLEQGQFELFYQPQMDNGRITGCEALLRWHHPRDGFIPPASFVPLAEDTGLILPLGEWVLQAACRQLAAWAQDARLAHLSLAVNVSPRQFHQAGFVPQVLAVLAGTGADARRLKLELTEGLLLEDVEDTIQKMVQLKGYGVGFSLDDFGTGYSSLAYLKRLPLDQLKIDQGFVRDVLTDPNDAAIARTIVALGTSLGLRVIAEGVETEAQRAFLARNHCHAWQGYLLSPPVPVAEFEALVQRHNHA
jgi:diguanylate cyclase (GGDEF)-like protein/PAS domain S-box-containing protein